LPCAFASIATACAQHRASCNRCSLKHWRHDGRSGLPCALCPGGAECEVCPEPGSLVVGHVADSEVVINVFVQGGEALPYPLPDYWALSTTSGNVTSLRTFDTPGSENPPRPIPPIFLPCQSGECKGGRDFSCTPGTPATSALGLGSPCPHSAPGLRFRRLHGDSLSAMPA
jgi:hypothetical protein